MGKFNAILMSAVCLLIGVSNIILKDLVFIGSMFIISSIIFFTTNVITLERMKEKKHIILLMSGIIGCLVAGYHIVTKGINVERGSVLIILICGTLLIYNKMLKK